jgi:Fe2+ transport system protein B
MAEGNDINGSETLERSSEEIRQNISEKLESLSKTVDQLGTRVHETFDWREQVVRHPYVALGVAAGVGFLLAGLFKPSPSPGERIMDAIGDTAEDISEKLHASLKEGTFNKTIAPSLVATVGTIMLKSGIDFLLAKATEDKPAQDKSTNGRQARPRAPSADQAKRVV